MGRVKRSSGLGVMLRAPPAGRVVRFRASTAAVSRHGTIVRPEGIRLRRFARCPSSSGAASGYGGPGGAPSMNSVIGRVVGWRRGPRAFGVSVRFAPPEAAPRRSGLSPGPGWLHERRERIGYPPPVARRCGARAGARRSSPSAGRVGLLRVSLVPVPSEITEAVALARNIAQGGSSGAWCPAMPA